MSAKCLQGTNDDIRGRVGEVNLLYLQCDELVFEALDLKYGSPVVLQISFYFFSCIALLNQQCMHVNEQTV